MDATVVLRDGLQYIVIFLPNHKQLHVPLTMLHYLVFKLIFVLNNGVHKLVTCISVTTFVFKPTWQTEKLNPRKNQVFNILDNYRVVKVVA